MNRALVSLELFSFYVDKRATVLAWLKQNRRRRRVIAGAAFSDELQRRFVEEIPRLRLGEGLYDLLQTPHNARRYRVRSF